MAVVAPNLGALPDEVLLQILSHLAWDHVVALQRVCRCFFRVCRDNNVWRNWCFSESPVGFEAAQDYPEPQLSGLQPPGSRDAPRARRARMFANWDPSFPGERTNWYEEFVHRHGPICSSWFQQPRSDPGRSSPALDVRGLALYTPSNSALEAYAVSPLDDGSVCIWDVKGSSAKAGSITAKSEPGLLSPSRRVSNQFGRTARLNPGIVESVTVDSQRRRAFFAVQTRLVEVDLETLAVVGETSFEWTINTLSAVQPSIPLTVGTTQGLHLYDPRSPPTELPLYAPLAQPCPLSILHLQQPGDPSRISDDIFVAGRFSNILNYDRRIFPTIKGSIHSGAGLCSLTSIPYPHSCVDSEYRREGLFSEDEALRSKMKLGSTLVACGEYKNKGALELYGLAPSDPSNKSLPRIYQTSTTKNRQSASASKLLSVTNHGTRLLYSDGQGNLRWVERDGSTEVRRFTIGPSERSSPTTTPTDEIALKILTTGLNGQSDDTRANCNDVLLWTGEKLGLVSFTTKAGTWPDDFGKEAKTPQEAATEHEEEQYAERFKLALRQQARDVHFVRGLGAGSSRSSQPKGKNSK